MNWILLRGLGREKRHWLDFPNELSANPSSQILCIDLPGVSDNANASAPITVLGHVEYLRQSFLKLRKPEEPYGLIGISFGGMLAMKWAEIYPNDFKKLVLINASAKDLSPTLQRMSPFALYCLSRIVSSKNIRLREKNLLKLVSNLKFNDPNTIDKMVEIAETAKIPGKTIARQLLAAAQFSAPQKINVPTLILASLKDRMVDVRCSKALAEKLSAQIKFHEDAGHDLTLDAPAWVAKQIQDFS